MRGLPGCFRKNELGEIGRGYCITFLPSWVWGAANVLPLCTSISLVSVLNPPKHYGVID